MANQLDSKIIVALDYADEKLALDFTRHVSPLLCKLKIGKELFTRAGPQLVRRLVDQGFDVFLDLKFHDIPATVAGAIAASADLGVWMVNVHCLGGSRMLEAARNTLDRHGGHTLLTGVTVLTSMQKEDLVELGIDQSPQDLVFRLASLAATSGLDGIVCSGQEAGEIKRHFGNEFLRVTPGIRPAGYGSSDDDQRRILTPGEALAGGSSYLVIGRPVTGARDPAESLLAIKKEIGEDGGRD